MFTPSPIQFTQPGAPQYANLRAHEDFRRPLPFRRLLPLGQLLLCALLLLPFRGVIFMELFHIRVYSFAPDSGTKVGPDGKIQIPPNPAFQRWLNVRDMVCNLITALNIPGGMLQLPTAIFSNEKREWSPSTVEFRIWRAVTWPIVALPFWWMAGRGIEALLAARRKVIAPAIRWWEVSVGSVLLAGGTTVFIGFLFFLEPNNRNSQLEIVIGSFGMWAIFGGVIVLAKFLQWRIAKKTHLYV